MALVTASGFDEPLKYGSAEGKEAEAIYDTFEKAYLNSGQKYPLLFGGSEIGAVDVEAAVGISCESLTATVRPSVPLPNDCHALPFASAKFDSFGELLPQTRLKAHRQARDNLFSSGDCGR